MSSTMLPSLLDAKHHHLFLGKTLRVEALYGREYKWVVQQDCCMGFSDQLYQAFFFLFRPNRAHSGMV